MVTALTVAALLWSLISCPVNAAEPAERVEHLTHETEPVLSEERYADHRSNLELRERLRKQTAAQSGYHVERAGSEESGKELEEPGKRSSVGRGESARHRGGKTAGGRAVRDAKWIGAGVIMGLSLLGALIMWESSRVTSRRRTS
ncbi:hypothetical protein [Methanopyrus sp.]